VDAIGALAILTQLLQSAKTDFPGKLIPALNRSGQQPAQM